MTSLLLLFLAAAGTAVPPEPPRLFAGLDIGPRPVGFRVLNHRDPSRRLADGSLRPIQVSVFYPAAAGAAPRMTYGDYVAVAASEMTLAPLDAPSREAALAGYSAFLGRQGIGIEAATGWLATPMAAVRDAAPATGRFPLIAIAAGNGGAVADQALLAEYLASHGYLVATCPSPLRLGAVMESDRDVLPVAREQARDLAFAIAQARTLGMADRERLGVVGYSFGARAALLLAPSTRGLRALVSLDGGIGSRSARDWLPTVALDWARVAAPILHVYEDVEDFMSPDFTLLASLHHAERTLVRIQGMRHVQFITFGMASAMLPGMGVEPSDALRLRERVRAVFLYTRSFLDAHVDGNEEARQLLERTPVRNGFPEGLVTVSVMKKHE